MDLIIVNFLITFDNLYISIIEIYQSKHTDLDYKLRL